MEYKNIKYKNKMLIKGHHSTGGRNNRGRITCFHRGGGHKRRARWVNFNYSYKKVSEDKVSGDIKLVYDCMRSGQIGFTENGKYELLAKENYEYNRGVKLGDIPAHTSIFNIEMVAGKGGQLVRSAGCFATVINHVGNYTRIRLPSGEQRLIPSECKCSIGIVGGVSEKEKSLRLHRIGKGKAGRSRWLGRRPTVRGTARNPVDHPHGGGQGKTSGGRPSVTPWSIAKGVRTSSGRGWSYVVVSRRNV